MNTAAKFEQAFKIVLQEQANTLQPIWLRTSYDNADLRNMTSAQIFPQVFIQVSSPYTETEGTTWAVDFSLSTATFFEDDINANINSNISGAVENIIFGLVNFKDETIVSAFVAELQKQFDNDICFGGLTLSNTGGYLTINDGALVSMLSGTIHFTM